MKIQTAALTLVTAALAVVPALGASASAATVAAVTGAYTDNYKASYNADPTKVELRSWLAMRSVTGNGVTYTPSTLPAAGPSYVAADTGLAMRGSDGSSAVLTASTTSANTDGHDYFRTDANGDFGLRITELSRDALKTAPIHETLNLVRGGVLVSTVGTDYSFDAAVFNAVSPNIEYNGPGGRWYVSGAATRLNWESTAPSSTDTTAPTLTSVSLPTSTTTRTVSVGINATDNVAVAQARFANEDGVWSAWQAFAPTMTWTLSSTASTSKGVSTQVRDAAGNLSGSIYTKITYTASTAPDTTAPTLTSVTMPASTVTRAISITVNASDNVGVSAVRFANEDGIWSTWQAFTGTQQWTLSASTATSKGVSTQVRDAAGNLSGSIYTKITCSCG